MESVVFFVESFPLWLKVLIPVAYTIVFVIVYDIAHGGVKELSLGADCTLTAIVLLSSITIFGALYAFTMLVQLFLLFFRITYYAEFVNSHLWVFYYAFLVLFSIVFAIISILKMK